MKVYLDNAATTKVDAQVVKEMNKYHSEVYGNASSQHQLGQAARMAIEESRAMIAKAIRAKPDEIIFTSGGTEGNNITLKSIAFSNKDKGNHIITTKVEHDCVLNACKWLETQGFELTYLDVDEEGFVKPDVLENAITEKTILVSIIHGNNEIGTINDLKVLGEICKKHNVYFHTDACQSLMKAEIDVRKQPVDLITLNAHKMHGPKGVGALYIREGVNIGTWQHGGGQEKNLRSGTENVPGIAGFAKAVKIAKFSHVSQMQKLRDKLIDGVLEKIPDVKLNGPRGDKRLCNNINFSFKYVEGESIGGLLDAKGVASSTGSACSSAKLEASHVLLALGLPIEDAHGSLRLSLSRETTEQDIDYVLDILPGIITKLRKMSPFAK